jgi:DNA-binding MarR family transcriptional regulator
MTRHGHLFHHYWQHIHRHHFGHFLAQEEVLTRILKHEPLAQSALLTDLGVKPASLSELLSKLEKRQLIRREKSPKDKRESLIYLTAVGKKMAEKLKKRHDHFDHDFLDVLSAEEQAQLVAIMEKLNQRHADDDGGHDHFSWRGRHWGGWGKKTKESAGNKDAS